MTKTGKKLIAELEEVIRCEHRWKVRELKSKTISICQKCGIRVYTFPRLKAPSHER